MAHPLVQDVLDVRCRAGEALDAGAGAAERRVRRLGHGDACIVRLLQEVHEPQAVVAQQDRVGVERQQEVAVRDADVARLAVGHRLQHGTVRRLLEPVGAAHECDVGVEVHRLVGFVGRRGVLLALEDGQFGVEGPGQAPVELVDAVGGERRALFRGGLDSLAGEGEFVGERAEHLVGEEQVDVVVDRLAVGHVAQPAGRPGVLVGERTGFGCVDERSVGALELESEEGIAEAEPRFGEQVHDVAGERAGLIELRGDCGVCRVRVVVEQEDDPQRRVLLQCGGQQGGAHDVRLFCVGRHEHGHRRLVVGEVPVQFRAGNAHMLAEPLQGALACDQVHQRGEGEERDDHDVADGFHREAEVLGSAVEELPDDRRDDVDHPEAHGQHDRNAAEGDLPVRGAGVDRGEGFCAALGAELSFSGRLICTCRAHFRVCVLEMGARTFRVCAVGSPLLPV